jgi:two-component system NtrC family sensor kinase
MNNSSSDTYRKIAPLKHLFYFGLHTQISRKDMKSVFSILLVAICSQTSVVAQDSAINRVVIKSIPPNGIVLNEGWKFREGDNRDWSKPDLDDRDWQAIDPTLDIHDSSLSLKAGDVGWFRLHITIDSSILTTPLALTIKQSGASEFFLNGVLIERFGLLDNVNKQIIAYDPLSKPILFPLNHNTNYVLAVRFALQPEIHYTTTAGRKNPAFFIRINSLTNSNDIYLKDIQKARFQPLFRSGIFLLLFILHTAFFTFYPSRRANLYLCLYALIAFLSELVDLNVYWVLNSVEYLYYGHNLSVGTYQVTNFLMLTAIYSLFGQKRDWEYWILLGLTGIGIVLTLVAYDWGHKLTLFFIGNLLNIQIVRITFKSVTAGKKGAWIIAAGTMCFLIFSVVPFLPFAYQISAFGSTFTLGDLFYNLANLAIPISSSIYLGLDFGFTNTTLNQKLIEVENLGQKNLGLEREKHQLLVDQNEKLERQVNERTTSLTQSLKDLKETQSQLIQSEKMASLGELTAGIAHEIQNPLNFVNNFSEVNKELLSEMKEEIEKGNLEDVKSIAATLIDNQEKINHHGKRADAIVKNMLQHSRSSSGIKEPVNINALTDEYLKLAYHGLRAKDKSFNVTLQTNFDEGISTVNVIPQDIGRLILNLLNNAFYAVREQRNQNGDKYEPMVSISTKKSGHKVLISVKDNGIGIPEKVLDKIFQPFFTTKPTGQGTGLGLSLSYDIVKAHGGDLKVETKEGEGSEFVIQLPLS